MEERGLSVVDKKERTHVEMAPSRLRPNVRDERERGGGEETRPEKGLAGWPCTKGVPLGTSIPSWGLAGGPPGPLQNRSCPHIPRAANKLCRCRPRKCVLCPRAACSAPGPSRLLLTRNKARLPGASPGLCLRSSPRPGAAPGARFGSHGDAPPQSHGDFPAMYME